MKITACIIALNEQDRLADAITSARECCDEVVVVDGGSSDGTAQCARECGATVYDRRFDDYTPQKNFANSTAKHDWVLSLDADERVSRELAAEINALRAPNQTGLADVAAYAFPRHTYYLGRLIRHNWYPDVKPRLFHRDRARWTGELVHESLEIRGRVGRLHGPINHFTYRDISDHVRRIDSYSTRAATKMLRAGIRHTFAGYALLPVWTFFRFYILKAGFLDRWPGFVVAALSSWSVMLKYLKLRELLRSSRRV